MTHFRAVPAQPDRLTVDAAAAALHCSRRTVFRLIKAGELKSRKVGRERTIARVDVDRYLDRQF